MLINFPESQKGFVRFCENHFGICLLIGVGIDLILNLLLCLKPYEVVLLTEGNIKYNSCELTINLGHMFLGLIYLYKIFIGLSMIILVFVEWNIKQFKQDIHYITASMFTSIIIYIIYAILNVVKITGYREQFIIPASISYIFGTTNFIMYFAIRLLSKNPDNQSQEIDIKKAKYGAAMAGTKNSFEKYMSNASLNHSGSAVGGPKKMSLTDRLVSLHNFGDEIKKSSDLSKQQQSSINSSNTNISTSLLNLRKYSRSSNNLSNSNLDEVVSTHRRASQICAIPENKIPDIVYSSAGDKIDEDNSGKDDSKTRSYDNVFPSFTRVTRINSTPNKNLLGFGQGNMRSYENFSNSRFIRKGSNVSFTNVHPVNALSFNNLPSRKSSVHNSSKNNSLESIERVSQKGHSTSNISNPKPMNAISSDYISMNSQIKSVESFSRRESVDNVGEVTQSINTNQSINANSENNTDKNLNTNASQYSNISTSYQSTADDQKE